nr:hypothetical protein BaRGS_023960 [Batillaria attramentaria]
MSREVLRIVRPGENIQVGQLEVHVMSAVYRHDYPLPGAFNLVLLVEWMEMARIVGVDVVQVFYHILSKRTLDVFLYYESTGFVILSPTTPAVKKGGVYSGYRD